MLRRQLDFICILGLLLTTIACNRQIDVQEGDLGWKMVKIDSFTVSYPKEVHGIAFNGQVGVFYHFKDVSLTQFDTKGQILRTTLVPEDGPQAMGYIVGMRYRPDGSLLLQSLNGEIGIMDSSLNLSWHFRMPFQSTLPTMRSNVKSMDSRANEVFVYFPGRNGANPFEKGFFKDNYLLEKIDLTSGQMQPVFKLSMESKFQEDTYHDIPYVLLAVSEEEVLYVLDNEPIVYSYTPAGGDFPTASIPLEARKFVQVKPKPIPLGNIDGVYPAVIDGIYPIKDGFAVTYGEGLEKEEVERQQYVDPRVLKSIQRNVLKVYIHGKGWSNEIDIPREISDLIHFEGLEGISYGLKNAAYGTSQQSDGVTIYKLKLVSNQTGSPQH